MKQLRGFWIVVALSVLLSVGVALYPNHWLGWGLTAIWGVRVIAMKQRWLMWLCVIVGLGMGAWTAWRVQLQRSSLPVNSGDSAAVRVLVSAGSWQVNGNRLTLIGEYQGERVQLLVELANEAEQRQWLERSAGGVLRINGQWQQPDGARNFDQFDYRQYLASQQVFWQIAVSDYAWETGDALPFDSQWLRHHLYQQVQQLPETALRQAILLWVFGEYDGTSALERDDWRFFGIGLLLSITGVYVQALWRSVRYLLLRIGVCRQQLPYWELACCAFIGYLSDWRIGVLKVLLLAIVRWANEAYQLYWSRVDRVSLVAIVLLVLNPTTLATLPYQMSVSLSFLFALMPSAWLAPGWCTRCKRAVCVLLFSAPMIVGHFHILPWLAWVVNLLLMPVMSYLIPVVWVLFLLSLTPLMAGLPLLWSVGDWVCALLFDSLNALSQWRWAVFIVGRPHVMLIVCYSVIFIWWLMQWWYGTARSKQWYVRLLSCACASLALIYQSAFNPFGQVMMIDIGQGDSVLVQLPFNQLTVLIDTGGELTFPSEAWAIQDRLPLARRVLLPVLRAQGVDRIDVLVLSHADTDHIGALRELLPHLPIHQVVYAEGMTAEPLGRELIAQLTAKGTRLIPVRAPQQLAIGDLAIDVWHPEDGGVGDNDSSLVFTTTIGQLRWLFTGDFEAGGEQHLLTQRQLPQIDVLKVAHHGSQTSTTATWLDTLQPRVALVSAGRNNRYGHPHAVVLERLDARGIVTFRTDTDGAVRYRFSFFAPGRWETVHDENGQ